MKVKKRARTLEQVLRVLEEHRVILEQAKVDGVPSMLEAIIGERPAGSWWSHPDGKLVYRLAEAAYDSGQLLALRLIGGKVTWVHRSLWPQILRVVTDRAWRAKRLKGAGAAVVTLCKALESGVVVGAKSAEVKKVDLLLLAHSESVHTERGHHERRPESWKRWAKRVGAVAATGSLEEALAAVREAVGGRATALDE